MIGLKAVLNNNASHQQVALSSVELVSTHSGQEKGFGIIDPNNPKMMLIDTNSQTSDLERNSRASKIRTAHRTNIELAPVAQDGAPIIGIIGVDLEQEKDNKNSFVPRTESRPQALMLGMGSMKRRKSRHENAAATQDYQAGKLVTGSNNNSPRNSPSPTQSKLNNYQDQIFVSVEGQHIQIADGVLPMYREQRNKR